MSALEIHRLRKEFVDARTGEVVPALEEVSFGIGRGEFVAVLGPSGCGKTTLLNIVAGFERQTAGTVEVNGEPVEGPSPERGVVFQHFALFPWKTVLGNVLFGLRMRGVPRREREPVARRFLELVGLAGFERKFPHELSGGMQQRLGVARVLANEPAIMLMDEPFGSLDAQTRRTLQVELMTIVEASRPTVFFVTHDVEEAVFLADRIVVLSSRPGRVREIVPVPLGRPRYWRAVLESPDFRRTAGHLMDLLAGGEPSVQDDPDSA
ncbi:ABC transporter ATP-binding protein [Amycolatopsis cihanbeyliensis]|uniref:NitT/TauT family transport system ATP-binding protein n=1 Tax=Amycolatopsis cihanbeyliensis TaxID=1128664 RepID=A0A542DFW2_AMYCI|nr:ABC transporter ATP-binding protein [Amycolatopsis cihanbeyliensis]TQJ01956.1 NitT/TauT family transport system ATP-binding protein [Amycolatopsis cihanbeyliensis]